MADKTDIPICEPMGRDTSPTGLSAGLSQLYQSLVLTQKYDRQARAGLVALTTVTVPSPVTVGGLSVSNPPTQAEVQAIAARLDSVATKLNSALAILQFMKDAMDNNLQTLN